MAKLRMTKSLYAVFLGKTAWYQFWILYLAFPPFLFLELILLKVTSFHIHNVYFWYLNLIVKGQVKPYFKNQVLFCFFFFKEYYGSLCFQQKRENDFITCNHIVTFLFVLWMCGVFWYEEIFLKIKNEFPKSILICGSSWYEHPHNRPTFLSKCVSWLGCQVLKRHRL